MKSPGTSDNLERFRALVLEDDQLLEQLRRTSDLESFVALTVRLAHARGCALGPEQVRLAVQEARRAWLEILI